MGSATYDEMSRAGVRGFVPDLRSLESHESDPSSAKVGQLGLIALENELAHIRAAERLFRLDNLMVFTAVMAGLVASGLASFIAVGRL